MTVKPTGQIAQVDAHILDVLRHRVGKDERAAKIHDWFTATVLALRDSIIDRWMESTRKTYAESGKRVYYLSLEFLIGRLLRDALSNMEMTREMEQALRKHGLDLAEIEELEPDAARQVVPASDDRTVGPAAAVHPAPPDPTAAPR